jgi:hypothetical protein
LAWCSRSSATIVDAVGEELSGPVDPGNEIYLRPHPGARSATVTMIVPGTADGYGGRVLTGVARDEVASRYTPVALAIPAQLVGDFDIDWSAGAALHRGVRGLEHPGAVGFLVGADHVHDGVDQRQVGERLREVAQVPPGARLDFLGVEVQRTGE